MASLYKSFPKLIPVLLLLFTFLNNDIISQTKSFPDAEGFGRFTTGGRGGRIIYVTNLNDAGSGSLRDAIGQSGKRIILFKVSGIIALKSDLVVSNGDVTIAGQSSPNGIFLRDRQFVVSTGNVIIRYMSFGLGTVSGQSKDTFTVWARGANIYNVVIDHCEMFFSKDENFSIVGTSNHASGPYYGCHDVTSSHNLMAAPLSSHDFNHFIKYQTDNVTLYCNGMLNGSQRNPNMNAHGELINNYILYNGGRGVTLDESNINVIGNYVEVGSSGKSANAYMGISGQGNVGGKLFVQDNVHTGTSVSDPWDIFSGNLAESNRTTTKHNYPTTNILSSGNVRDYVLDNAGNNLHNNSLRQRVLDDAKRGIGNTDISSPNDLGGWPSISMGSAYVDSDGDGMEDAWETDNGLNPNSDDGSGDLDGDGYTNVEEFLECLIDPNCDTSSPPVNSPPTISSIGDKSIDQDQTLGPINFTVGDSETAAGSLTVTASSNNQSLVDNSDISLGGSGANRNITVTPLSGQFGTVSITITVSDGTDQATESFILDVNEVVVGNTAPTISGIPNQSIIEDETLGPVDFTIGDAETSPASLTVTASSNNQQLVPNGNISLTGNGANRQITVTPASGQQGTASITVTVSDGTDNTTESFVLTVTNNTAPTISDIPDQTTDEDVAIGPINFSVGDAETAVNSLTVTGRSADQVLVPNSNISIGGNGANRNITITPASGRFGTVVITVTVNDGSNTTSDSFVLTVVEDNVPINTPPTITSINNQSTEEGTTLGPLTFNIGDAESAPGALQVSATSTDQQLLPNNGISLSGNGAQRGITVTPAAGETGTCTVTIEVSDGTNTTTESFNLTVTGNSPPTISSITNKTIKENQVLGPLNFTVGDSETAPNNLVVTATSDDQQLIPNGNISLGGSGTNREITITPVNNQSGTADITISVSDGTDTVTETFSVSVTSNLLPTISSISNKNIKENQVLGPLNFTVGDSETAPNNLIVTATSDDQQLIPNGNIVLGGSDANREITITPANNQSGTANITISVSDGTDTVTESFSVTVTNNEAPTITQISDQTTDLDTPTGPINFTIGDAETPVNNLIVSASTDNQTLVPNGNLSISGNGADRNIDVSPAPGEHGTVTITVVVDDGEIKVSESFQLTVTGPPSAELKVSITVEDITCFNGNDGSANAVVQGGDKPYQYVWSNNAKTASIANLAEGDYAVTVTDASGNSAQAVGHVSKPDDITITSTIIHEGCAGSDGSIELFVSGGSSGVYTYQWSNEANTKDISNLSAGIYEVTITDVNGCNKDFSFQINANENSIQASGVVSNATCAGGDGSIALDVSGGQGDYSYSWSNGSTTKDISGLDEGIYTVTITDDVGCSTVKSFEVEDEQSSFIFSVNVQDANCGSEDGAIDLTVNGDDGSYQYNWSNGASTANISNLAPGVYEVNILLPNGCRRSASFVVSSIAGPGNFEIESVVTNASCSGDDGSVDLTLDDDGSPYTFDWSNGATTQNVEGLSPGSYEVTVTNTHGCYVTKSVLLNTDSGPSKPSISQTQDELRSDAADGYQWYLNGDPIKGADSQTYVAQESGSYFVEVFDNRGCSAMSDELDVTVEIACNSNVSYVDTYPVPATNVLNVDVGMCTPQLIGFGIFTMDGRPVMKKNFGRKSDQVSHRFNITRLVPGIYLIKIKAGKEVLVRRFVVN